MMKKLITAALCLVTVSAVALPLSSSVETSATVGPNELTLNLTNQGHDPYYLYTINGQNISTAKLNTTQTIKIGEFGLEAMLELGILHLGSNNDIQMYACPTKTCSKATRVPAEQSTTEFTVIASNSTTSPNPFTISPNTATVTFQ